MNFELLANIVSFEEDEEMLRSCISGHCRYSECFPNATNNSIK
jgi:hypothetical protein